VVSEPADIMSSADAPIRVKFLTKAQLVDQPPSQWLRRFPESVPRWGRCHFIFDAYCRQYDWLVVYDDLPRRAGSKRPDWIEELACPRDRTLLITTEPSSIKLYGRAYLRQFGHVLTSQESWAVTHPGAIRRQPGLIWFYGAQKIEGTYDDLVRQNQAPEKPKLIGTVCSSKRMGHTLHAARYDFTQELKRRLPDLEIYGHGVRPIKDKSAAVEPFRYHVAIENHVAPHHWTEKLADAFLGWSLPFYFGAPNASDYFPTESFIPIDIFDVAGAERIIRDAFTRDEYTRRLPAIREARRRVLECHGTFPQLAKLIEERSHTSIAATAARVIIRARRLARIRRPLLSLRDLFDRIRLTRPHVLGR
jgi:hypothetical protein